MNSLFQRIFQDDKGEILEPIGKTVEKIICINSYDEEKKELSPCVFWLKCQEEIHWHRFYLDTSVCIICWDIYEDCDRSDLEDTDNFPWNELSTLYQLANAIVLKIQIFPLNNRGVQLEINFSNQKRLILTCHKINAKNQLSVMSAIE
jgi:GTPase SAR1 family protein